MLYSIYNIYIIYNIYYIICYICIMYKYILFVYIKESFFVQGRHRKTHNTY